MGHIRLGDLPRTRRWQEVVALIAGGAQADQVANAAVRAAERVLGRAFQDDGLVEALWLLLRLPLAARSGGLTAALRGLALDVPDPPGLMDVLAAITAAVDARLGNNRGRTDLGEMAQMAVVETFVEVVGPRVQGLFDAGVEGLRRAFADLATTAQVSHLGRRYFARLMFRFLDFYLSRALPDQVGEGRRFNSLRQVELFYRALEAHCGEAARVVEAFSGEWFSLHRYQAGGDITRDLAARFGHGALRKLTDELKRGAGTHG
jgi:hypothetical protein